MRHEDLITLARDWYDRVPPSQQKDNLPDLLVRVHVEGSKLLSRDVIKTIGELGLNDPTCAAVAHALRSGAPHDEVLEQAFTTFVNSVEMAIGQAAQASARGGGRLALTLDLDAFQVEQRAWTAATFPGETEQQIIDHLREEVGCATCGTGELAEGCDKYEIADIVLLAMALATRRSFSLSRLMREKFEICKRRKWGLSEGGYFRHVKDEPAEYGPGGDFSCSMCKWPEAECRCPPEQTEQVEQVDPFEGVEFPEVSLVNGKGDERTLGEIDIPLGLRHWFRKVAAHPEGAVVHDGDCRFFASQAPICTCGLLHALQRLSPEKRSVYPGYGADLVQHEHTLDLLL